MHRRSIRALSSAYNYLLAFLAVIAFPGLSYGDLVDLEQLSSLHTVNYQNDSGTYSNGSRPIPFGKARVAHQVYGLYGDILGASFTWSGPGDFKFQNDLPDFVASLRTVEFDTYLSLVPETGTIEFVKHRSGITIAGPASFYRPVVSMLIHYTGDVLLSSFSGSPTEIEFRSELNPLGDSTYEYVYSVTNLTNNPITFDWSSAGMTGIVGVDTDPLDPGDNVVSRRVVSPFPAIELPGSASFVLGNVSMTMPAEVFVPVPEPTSLALLAWGAAACTLVALRRRRWMPLARRE